ncbi:MAG: DUF899 domain-containing protein [Deltaproteobacteria bacterium]|nr:DUF899 domain-containing protein [Deltaproteobacteria bacterium]
MQSSRTHLPTVVTREAWLQSRKLLLEKEKAFTRARDALNAERRKLPMVELTKQYSFEGPNGRVSFVDLFDSSRQLIIYHFMFDPDSPPPGQSGAPWSEGCPGCSFMLDNIPHLSHFRARDTSFVVVSRAPLAKIEPFKRRMGWTLPWVSSFGTEFNYDFQVTIDPEKGSTEWNYRDTAQLVQENKIPATKGELPGASVFLRDGERVFHTYSTYARGLDALMGSYQYLDLTPFGRQEEWEDSPEGWPQSPTHSWLRHHDKYEGASQRDAACCCASHANR